MRRTVRNDAQVTTVLGKGISQPIKMGLGMHPDMNPRLKGMLAKEFRSIQLTEERSRLERSSHPGDLPVP